jgi:eukaryotic-like serine/threonine-protein kinase
MTPERWRQIGELFKATIRIDPSGREAWLRATCDGDDDLRSEVARLLAQDEQADRVGFLTPPEATAVPPEPTTSWLPSVEVSPRRPGPDARAGVAPANDTEGFTPRQAIAPQTRRHAISEPPSVVRARLRELPLVYISLLTASNFWRRAVLGREDNTLQHLDLVIIVVLVGLIALLWSRWPVSLDWLKALELGMIGLLAGRITFVQYRIMLTYSMLGDKMLAQLTMKNVVLLTSVLILTYGLYVPKSWRRAAVVVGPLALLPFATLLVLHLRYPQATGWLTEGWHLSDTPRYRLFILDALVLAILAVGSAYGARTISLLRREVVEARQLGQYRLGRRLGAGGMGEVFLAEHMLLKRPCAVKLIRPGEATDPRALERFEREVRLTATLSHPNIVDVYDYGRAEDGTYYYVMEYLPGLSLEDLVQRHGPLPPGRVVYLLRQVCEALGVAHAAGLIHRDIKPSNVIAARRSGMDDVAKLLDFGLVLPRAGSPAPHLSAEGQVLGTPLFMAPEQVTGGRVVDERSDLYSLGAVAYLLLTGRPPFEGANGIGVMIAHARDPVVPPSRDRADVPGDLERVVLRCLAKEPTERFPDAESMERALGACSCAGDWDRLQAARWWQDADLSSADTDDRTLSRSREGLARDR